MEGLYSRLNETILPYKTFSNIFRLLRNILMLLGVIKVAIYHEVIHEAIVVIFPRDQRCHGFAKMDETHKVTFSTSLFFLHCSLYASHHY